MKGISGLCTLVALSLTVAGCMEGAVGSSERATVYKVKGKVTYLGSPLIGGVVSFAPKGNQPAAVGRTNDAGEFTLTTYSGGDGAAEGDYKVVVMLPESSGEAAPEDASHSTDPNWKPPESHSTGSKRSSGTLLPPKYGKPDETPLTAKVEPKSDNYFTFEIK